MTPEEAVKFIKEKKHHKFYDISCQMAYDMSVHADNVYPKELIGSRRPKESDAIQKYREEIYVSKTEAPVYKVMNSLMKIRKSQDWMIKYPKNNPKIAEDESLENYMEKDFPKHTSFTNWFWAICFPKYLIDANAVTLVIPENLIDNGDGVMEVEEENEYLEPYPIVFNSHQILDYSSEHYLLHSDEKNVYVKNKQTIEGNIYYLVDEQFITTLKEINQNQNGAVYEITTYEHALEELPIVKVGGWVKDEMRKWTLYKSRISPMLPELKEAVREYSDLQAEVVQHIHSTLWAMESQKCTNCSGSGRVIGGKDNTPIKCKECNGKGFYPFNPYENLIVRQPKAGESATPTPPVGYITKPIEIAKLQNERVQDHIFYALAAINFEFLMSTPLNQSGTAKQVDRSELDNFVHSIAEDVVRIYDDHYKLVAMYRYNVILNRNEDEIEKILPFINVPAKYDILSETFLIEEVAKAKTSNVNTNVINACEIEYANKKFGNDEDVRTFVINCLELDPFASETEDSIILKLQNGGISKQDYVIHCNIKAFVKRAVTEDEKFYAKTVTERQDILNGFADELIAENSAKGKVLDMVNNIPNDTTGNGI
jgi:hypothetical protein